MSHPNNDNELHGNKRVLVYEPPLAPGHSNVLNGSNNLWKKKKKTRHTIRYLKENKKKEKRKEKKIEKPAGANKTSSQTTHTKYKYKCQNQRFLRCGALRSTQTTYCIGNFSILQSSAAVEGATVLYSSTHPMAS